MCRRQTRSATRPSDRREEEGHILWCRGGADGWHFASDVGDLGRNEPPKFLDFLQSLKEFHHFVLDLGSARPAAIPSDTAPNTKKE
jgi:hypothetical protein